MKSLSQLVAREKKFMLQREVETLETSLIKQTSVKCLLYKAEHWGFNSKTDTVLISWCQQLNRLLF